MSRPKYQKINEGYVDMVSRVVNACCNFNISRKLSFLKVHNLKTICSISAYSTVLKKKRKTLIKYQYDQKMVIIYSNINFLGGIA